MLDFKYIIQESMRNKKKIDGIHPYAKATGLSAVLHVKFCQLVSAMSGRLSISV